MKKERKLEWRKHNRAGWCLCRQRVHSPSCRMSGRNGGNRVPDEWLVWVLPEYSPVWILRQTSFPRRNGEKVPSSHLRWGNRQEVQSDSQQTPRASVGGNRRHEAPHWTWCVRAFWTEPDLGYTSQWAVVRLTTEPAKPCENNARIYDQTERSSEFCLQTIWGKW